MKAPRSACFASLCKARAAFTTDVCPETLDRLLTANDALSSNERLSYLNDEMWREYRAKRASEGWI
jgi:hypothetical protein